MHGLSLTQVFVLQAIFSIALLVWDGPSSYLADLFGCALCIKLSAPIATVATVLYGFSTQYWQFVACELVLALGTGLTSGANLALLRDSLSEDSDEEFAKLNRRMTVAGFASIVIGSLLGIVLVALFGLRSTLIADGVLTGIGSVFAFKLVEANSNHIRSRKGLTAWKVTWQEARIRRQSVKKLSVWETAWQFGQITEIRWLITLGATLNTATYLAAWLAAPYYASLGIPAAVFSGVLALRNVVKTGVGLKVNPRLFTYAILAGGVYLGMATGQLWLIWIIVGHDIVHALQTPIITTQINTHISDELCATMNSVVSVIQRLVYSLAGPLVGLLIDHVGLHYGMSITGLVCNIVALIAMMRLRQLKTFQERN